LLDVYRQFEFQTTVNQQPSVPVYTTIFANSAVPTIHERTTALIVA
jgi:hypothetical protein